MLEGEEEERKCDDHEEGHETCDHVLLDHVVAFVDLFHLRIEVIFRSVELSKGTSTIETLVFFLGQKMVLMDSSERMGS